MTAPAAPPSIEAPAHIRERLATYTTAFRTELGKLFPDSEQGRSTDFRHTPAGRVEETFRAEVARLGAPEAGRRFKEHYAEQLSRAGSAVQQMETWASVQKAAAFGEQAHRYNLAYHDPHQASRVLDQDRERLAKMTFKDPEAFDRRLDQLMKHFGLDQTLATLARDPQTLGDLQSRDPRAAATLASLTRDSRQVRQSMISTGVEGTAPLPDPQRTDRLSHQPTPEEAIQLASRTIGIQEAMRVADGRLMQIKTEDRTLEQARESFHDSLSRASATIWKEPARTAAALRTAAVKDPVTLARTLETDPKSFGALATHRAGALSLPSTERAIREAAILGRSAQTLGAAWERIHRTLLEPYRDPSGKVHTARENIRTATRATLRQGQERIDTIRGEIQRAGGLANARAALSQGLTPGGRGGGPAPPSANSL